MRLDADRGNGGIQTTRRIVGDQPFTIGIDVTKVGKVPYTAYEWTIAFPNGLIFGSASENTGDTGLELCAAPANVSGVPQLVTMYGGCLSVSSLPVTFIGETTNLEVRCVRSGRFDVQLLSTAEGNGFGSSLLDHIGTEFSTTLTGITIDCQVGSQACADVTGDGRVTRDDLRFIIRNMSRLNPDMRADINGDGRVDRKDLSQATKQLGKRC